jgi:hypothetical protein
LPPTAAKSGMGHIRLRGHSFANVLLIAAQRPEASLVASYEQWQALGRQVNRGERGIQIIAKPAAAAPPTAGDTDPGVPGRAAVKQNRRVGCQKSAWPVSCSDAPGSAAGRDRRAATGPLAGDRAAALLRRGRAS